MELLQNQHQLIEKWTEKASALRWLHDSSHRHYKALNNRFSYISIVLSTITGIGGFGVAGTTSYVPYILASLNILTGLIASFQKFVRAAEKGEAHANVSRQYASFVRNVTMEMNMGLSDDEFVDFVKYFKNDYERLCSISPDVPKKVLKKFKKKFPNIENPPEICNTIINTDLETNRSGFMRTFTKPLRVSVRADE